MNIAKYIFSAQPSSPSRTHIELDSTSRQNSLNFDLYNQQSTQGIDVQQVSHLILIIKYFINLNNCIAYLFKDFFIFL